MRLNVVTEDLCAPIPLGDIDADQREALLCLHSMERTNASITDALLRVEVLRSEGLSDSVVVGLDIVADRLSAWAMTLVFASIALARGEADAQIPTFNRLSDEIATQVNNTLAQLRKMRKPQAA